jgi:hypothetical protein
VKIPAMREFMHWHRSMDGDPMHRWLRERIGDIIHSLDQHPEQHPAPLRRRSADPAPRPASSAGNNPAAPSRFAIPRIPTHDWPSRPAAA